MVKENLKKMRHSCEHVLTQAMLKLYPGIKMAMGPATEDGFYFDFDPSTSHSTLRDKSSGSDSKSSGQAHKISEADFPKIEAEMEKIIHADLPIKREEISIEKARKLFKGNPYKQEWLDEISKDSKKATIYKTGDDFVDLCAGPHVSSTGKIGSFKLLSVAGAYWRGSEKNKMLTRIYGTCFPTKKELDNHLKILEEAKMRDHRKLGPHLELFMLHDTAPGMPYWLPKGLIIINELINFWRFEHAKHGYQEIRSPLINKKELYVTSGHWEHYKENMFISETEEKEIYALKPMNCPNAMIVFASKTRSYRELPLRLSDTDTLHRYERSGTLNGLLRVREFSQDDAHIFISENQIKSEYKEILKIAKLFYSIFGIDYHFRLSTRPDDFMGDIKTWNRAEQELESVLKASGKTYYIGEKEGVFYGPKIDIMMRDSLGREWQTGTIQLDFQIPQRFKLKYTDRDGKEKIPIVIHRVIYGSLERFIGILIEHYSGAFPVWLAPVQTTIIPITDRHVDYANKVAQKLKEENIRIEIDDRNTTASAKIRDAELQKIPYILVVGDKEIKSKSVNVRVRGERVIGIMTLEKFLKKVVVDIDKKRQV